MRADIKVGITIAVILLIAGVVWYVVTSRPPEKPSEKAPGESEVAKAPGEPEKTDEVDVTEPLVRSIYETPAHPTLPVVDGTPAPDTTTPAPAPDTTSTDTGDDEWPSVPSRLVETPILPPSETDSTTPILVERTGTYVVKNGDSYWLIARNEWGDGRLHPHLEKANPKIPPLKLKPGMTIKIPTRPGTAGATTPSLTVAGKKHGSTGIDALTGKRYYIVKKDDNGFWGVSKAVYGEGKHFQLIEAANPKLDAKQLQPGQKVWYPEKPKSKHEPVVVRPGITEPVVDRTPAADRMPLATVHTGAPSKAVLPDGRVFD